VLVEGVGKDAGDDAGDDAECREDQAAEDQRGGAQQRG
jgi:hypothetical protein